MKLYSSTSGALAALVAGLLFTAPAAAWAADTVDAVTDPIPQADQLLDAPDALVDPVPGEEVIIDKPLPDEVPVEWVIRGGDPDVMYMAFGAGGADMDDMATQAAEAAADHALDRIESADPAPSKLP